MMEPREGETPDAAPPPKRPYQPPRIESEGIFETTALMCAKKPSGTRTCMLTPSAS
jgi:hypothetical protein